MTFKADRLEPGVFRSMIQRGRGCALMHVLEYGLHGIEDITSQACLINRARFDADTTIEALTCTS